MSSSANRLKVRLNPAAERAIRAGHPWIFDESLRQQNRPGRTGEIAVVYDRHDRLLALALFDADSPIRLRVLHTGVSCAIDGAWWRQRLEASVARRAGLFANDTNAHRLIHGESDGWPGLVLDRYAGVGVIKLYSAAWFPWLPELIPLFQLHCEHLVLRLSRKLQNSGTVWTQGQTLAGPPLGSIVEFLETGLRFEADVFHAQKTGFFLDQRENRRWVERLAAGRRTLNLFSYSGAFSVYAARGGAPLAVDVDINRRALAAAERHFELNRGVAANCCHEIVAADAFEFLENQTSAQFDLIILDPPSLAKRQSERGAALRAYERLAARAALCLRPRGILMAASCSAHVRAEEFFQAVRGGVRRTRRFFKEAGTSRHPPDHPASFPEAEYLKCVVMEAAAQR